MASWPTGASSSSPRSWRRVLGLILGLGRLAALRAVLLGDPGLLEAEGGGALSEVGLSHIAR